MVVSGAQRPWRRSRCGLLALEPDRVVTIRSGACPC